MILRRHDRYVLRAFWGAFVAVVLFFTLIIIVLDLADRFTKLNRQWEAVKELGYQPLALLAEFYATLVPFVWLRILPFCVPIAAALTLARLHKTNELSPLLTSGVSMRRIVLPIVASGLVVSGAMMWAQSGLVSDLSRRHMKLGRILGKRSPDRIGQIPHFHDPSGARLSMEAFMPLAQRMEAVWVTVWGDEGLETLLWYPELVWDDDRQRWIADRGGERIPKMGPSLGVRRERIPPGMQAPLEASLLLIEISLTLTSSLGLSFQEAAALQRANPDMPRFVMSHHELYVGPVSALLLLLLVLPFSVRVGRRTSSAIPGMLAAMGISGLFFGATYLASSLGGGGVFNPVVLAWLPTVVFGALGLALYLTLDD